MLLHKRSEKKEGLIHQQIVTSVVYARPKWYLKLLLKADKDFATINILSVYWFLISLLCFTVHPVGCATPEVIELCQPGGKCNPNNITDISVSNLNVLCSNDVDAHLRLQHILINKMHFDFCHKIHPIFTLPYSVFNAVNFTLNNSELLNVSSTVECQLISDLRLKDKEAENNFLEMKQILSRADLCSSDAKEEAEKGCELCEKSFKNWLCSGAFNFSINNKTLSLCSRVSADLCFYCPAMEPENSYGGYSAYECNEHESEINEISIGEECDEYCASIQCFDYLYPAYNSTR